MSQNFDLDQTPSPSSPDVSEMDEEVTLKTYARGDKIGGRYEVYEVITHGGMGDIYFCLDLEEDLPLALKTFKPRLIAKNPRIRDLFYQEVGTWVGLEKHPNIVRCYYLDYLDNLPFMFLEWIADPDRERTDLAYWLHKRGPLDLRLALNVTIDICRGLRHAVQKQPGLVHRDLKPANILITQNRMAKITDFGLATMAQHIDIGLANLPLFSRERQSLFQFGSFVGTPAYAAPELWTPGLADDRADIYAIGCILYEMLMGYRPFDVEKPTSPQEKEVWLESWQKAHKERVPEFPSGLLENIKNVIYTCLQKEPIDRFASVDELFVILSMIYEEMWGGKPKRVEVSEVITAMDYNGWGVSYGQISQYEKALKCFNKAIQIEPNLAIFYMNRGLAYSNLKQCEKALTDYDQAIQLGLNIAQLYSNRGNLYSDLKQFDEALIDHNRAIELNPYNAQSYINRGNVYIKLQQYEVALADYDQAIKLNPNHVPAYYQRGEVFSNLLQYNKALADFSKAIQLDSNYVLAYFDRAMVYINLESYEEALADFDRTIQLAPELTLSYFNRGNIYRVLQQYEKALADYSRAIELDPSDAEFYSTRGVTYSELKKNKEALVDYNKAIELNPNDANIYNLRGIILTELECYDEALTNFNQAIKLTPNNALILANRSNVYRYLQRYEKALNDCNRSIQLDPDLPHPYYNLGLLHYEQNNLKRALFYFEKALQYGMSDAVEPIAAIKKKLRGKSNRSRGKL